MLSKSCEYAIRSIVFIAQNGSKEQKIGIKTLSEELDIPSAYLGKILQKLTRNNVIQGVKGPGGGYFLNEICKETKIIRIIEVIDGLDFYSKCGLGLHQCSEEHPCPIHDELKIYRDGLWELFNHKTIKDLEISVEDGNSFIKNL